MAVAVVAAVGGRRSVVLRSIWASQTMKAAQAEARRIEAEARTRQKELILEARTRSCACSARPRKRRAPTAELTGLERRLPQRDEQLDQRTDMLEQRDRKLLDRERELDKAKREDLARAHAGAGRGPRARVGLTADDAKTMLLVEAVREEAEHDAVKLARAIERSAREEAQDKARDIVVDRDPARRGRPHRRAHGDRRPPAHPTR